MKKLILFVMAVVACLAGLLVFNSITKNNKNYYDVISYDQLDSEIQKSDNLILYVKKDGCIPCQNVEPIINDVGKKGNIKIVSIVTNTEKRIDEFDTKFNIKGTPTVIFFNKGVEIGRLFGAFDENTLELKMGEIYNEK